MLDFLTETFGGIDFSDSAVILVLLTIAGGTLIFSLLITWITYQFNLIIPKSKLSDETYVQAALRRYRYIIFFSRIAFFLSLALFIVFWGAHLLGFINIYVSPWCWYLIADFVLLCFFFGVVFRKHRGGIHTEDELKYTVEQKQSIERIQKTKKDQR